MWKWRSGKKGLANKNTNKNNGVACLHAKSRGPTTAHRSNNNLEILVFASHTRVTASCQTSTLGRRELVPHAIYCVVCGDVHTNVPAATIWQRDPSILQRLNESLVNNTRTQQQHRNLQTVATLLKHIPGHQIFTWCFWHGEPQECGGSRKM